MKFAKNPKSSGFTLVELLVVIAIIAVLASVTFMVAPRMMAKAKATESMQNIRQIGPVITTYATEHSMKLPAVRGNVTREDGTVQPTQWHEAILSMLYPETDPDDFKNKDWWKNNKTFLRNPLFKETSTGRGWAPLNPGYALNEMIAENLEIASGKPAPSHDKLMEIAVPLAALAEPSRTPLIAPYDNYYYRYDEAQVGSIEKSNAKDLLIEGKASILFVDGHLESMTPKEYTERKLHLAPQDLESVAP